MISLARSLGDLFDEFTCEAFRLETLSDYSGSGNTDAYRAFMDGQVQPENYNAEWLAEVRTHVAAGKRLYRVHLLTRPLTPYLRFELGWGYVANAMAGEEFYILDVTDRPNPLPEGVHDFWLFDSVVPAPMRYAEGGTFAGAEILPRARAAEFVAYRDTALAHAVPFADWWTKHGK
ncbi:hypothetical protein OG204_17090 [Streptomyces sp. NBC_01387]|uniref:DUF6879 family protein n=1 Tax=unclassified Streptomyces TaxID=2593676 RepID=UPI0020243D9E|nr:MULTISPECIES: DUF6879 family protein [unclassified Streptomyces]MCX4549922.1 hypothetical protein [Streptomyces sp. NBC_01500]WSC21439.1 hypothetical protein OIE60_18100 [Streptomyces sp. NBC_01766]WSV55376.1 hypothetical protein OG282_17665 [Streptomyces sp. NBC_01014]